MKILFKTTITITMLLMHINSEAQWINSITIQPANPTINDTITVLAECSFPSGGCSENTQFISIQGNNIYADALHCLGPLSVICNYTDTFKINPLPTGNYTFHFQVNAGFGPSPCTPGIVPGVNDSVLFFVSPATGVEEYVGQDAVFAFPNPVKQQFQLKGIESSEFPVNVEIVAIDGKLVASKIILTKDEFIDLSKFPVAVYQLNLTTALKNKYVLQIVKE